MITAAGSAFTQPYPTRPVRMVVPFSAGGPADAVARLVTPPLSETWSQQVVVDNRAGASGIIATDLTAKAAPDGYTLICISSSFTINASLFAKLPYDSNQDFTAIAPLAYGPGVVVVHPSVAARTLQEFIALAKAKPRALSYGSSGAGSPGHLTFELIKRLTGIDITHVPYKGMGPALIDLLGGQVQTAIPTISAAMPHVKSGRLRALAVTSSQRWRTVPDLPTVAESALPGFESVLWYGVLGPARMPAALVSKINADATAIMQRAEMRERLDAAGMEAMIMKPGAFDAYVKAEIVKWSKVVKDSGAKAE
ncbi:MAG: transporter substrate-binding protein [Betaproteobacteria bacterium]|nr:transporter substrate-binding protein [Betaproteobacteria bacterium]